MKLDTSTILEQLSVIARLLRQHAAIICLIVFAVIYGYIITAASGLSQQQPSDDAIKKELKQVAKPKVDESVAQTMLGLEDRNVSIRAIFEDARANPFTE